MIDNIYTGKPFHGYTCPNCCNATFHLMTDRYSTGEGTLLCAKCGKYVRTITQTEVQQFARS